MVSDAVLCMLRCSVVLTYMVMLTCLRVHCQGDLIESFLDLKRDKMEEVAAKMEQSVEDVGKVVEELARLH